MRNRANGCDRRTAVFTESVAESSVASLGKRSANRMKCPRDLMQPFARLAVTLIVFAAATDGRAVAQSDARTTQSETRSHRLLELPTKGTSDVERQVRLLQHLRSMFNPDDAGDAREGLSPEQLQMLQSLMKQFGEDLPDEIPEDMMPLLQQLAPQIAQSVATDPASRSQAGDLLRQYLKNRRLPDGSGRSGLPFPGGQNSTANQNPSAARNRSNQQPGSSGPGMQNNRPGTPTGTDGVRTMDELDRLGNSTRRSDGSSKINGSTGGTNHPQDRTSPRAEPDGSAVSPANPGRGNSDSDTGLSALENLFPQLRQMAEQEGMLSNGAEGSGRQPRGPGGVHNDDRSGAPSDQSLPSSVSNILRELENVPLEELGRLRTNAANGSSPANDGGATAEELEAEVRRQQQQVRDKLKSQGFQKTLRQIVSSAKKEARQAGPANANGINGPLMEIVNGVSKDVIELAKDAKVRLRTSTRDASSESRPAERSTQQSRSVGGRSGPSGQGGRDQGGIQKAASDFFKDLAGAAAEPPSPKPETARTDGVAPSDSAGSVALVVAGLCLLLLTACFLMRPGGPLGTGSGLAVDGRAVPSNLRSRADVIAAFHHVARTTSDRTEDWWTHRQVVEEVSQSNPDRSDDLDQLSVVYEQARYLPESEPLSQQQLRLAESALRRCR